MRRVCWLEMNMRLFALLLTAAPAFAQFDTAEVLGTVRDHSGSVISKAAIVLTNQGTGIGAKTSTSEDGQYTISNVKIGVYTVTAEAPGFSKAIAKDVTVNVNARQRVDLVLQVGAVTESIEVTAAAAVLETDTSSRNQLINTQGVVELPLNGRAYSDLALLTTGVLKSPAYSGGREGSFNVNGLRSTYNKYLLDGVDNNAYGTSNQGFANQVAQPSPDAVAEFKVITNNYSAEYGRSGGATIDVAMRSGTNKLHGTMYEFLRNTNLNAVGYIFGTRPSTFIKPTLQQNQFGFTAGGPVIKNRVFFFGDYEGFRSLARTNTFSSIPSLNDRLGILPVAVTNPQTGAIYPANTPIPATATSAFARKVLADLPALTVPGNTVRSNNLQLLALNKTYTDKFDAKMDGQINDRMNGFLRVSQRKLNNYNQPGISGPSGGGGNGYIRALNQQGTAGYTWTVNSSSILEGRFAVSRTDAGKTPPAIGGTSMLDIYGITGLPTTSELTGGLTPQTLSGFTGLGRQATNPQFQNPLSFNYKVNFTKNMGRHALKTGFEYVVIRTQVLDVNPLYGLDSYAGGFSKPAGGPADASSYAIADFLFGLRSAYQLATYSVGNYRQHEYFAYVQDDFRVNHTLTLNLGMRWEYATPRWERDNNLSNYDPVTNSMIKAKSGSIYDRALIDPDRKNFAPRIGFAWSAMPKLVVRGGYGIGYVHQNRVGSGDLLGINGPQVIIATVNQSNPLDPTFRTTQQGYAAGLTTPANFNPVAANVLYMPRGLKTPYVESWFFSVQHTLPLDTVLDVAYVGNHSVATPIMADYNAAFPQPTATSNLSLQARRPNHAFGPITWYDPAGFSSYNALQVKLERRFTKGLQFLNAFTWGKAIDNGTQALDGSNGNQASPQDVRNLASERGISNYDQKFNEILSLIYELPVGRNRRFLAGAPAVVDHVLGGWQFSIINTALSAQPINLRAWNGSVPSAFQTDGNLAEWRGGEAFRPNITGPVLASSGTQSVDNYFNKDNVALPTDPSHPFGNAGRNIARATAMNQLDLGLFKNFRLPKENMRLQFRSEMFNALNHTNFTAANGDRASASFGTIRGTYPARQIQFALKLMF
uniref:TonB-dependent receptor, plug n=1 Tax=Solibacter usitatus (strain Ellin6076) TaxID=234267 RepID=Q01WU0_SOLUE